MSHADRTLGPSWEVTYVRLGRAGQALAAFAQSLSAVQPAPKQRAVIMLEVATAARQDAAISRDTARADEAFGLAAEALAAGQRYGSERVIERSRQVPPRTPGRSPPGCVTSTGSLPRCGPNGRLCHG